ncbi:NucA/NucB deoxyribonuclease domain-containing protein [Streptomyces sp. NPDC051214]|uniref:NucA/NucB deoxyribonuclease domain-containing protein n=1 Tax=Streptomyces sp. NPDC051214 TaxID=3155282 RepID=UPI003426886E
MLTIVASAINGTTAAADETKSWEVVTHTEISRPSTKAGVSQLPAQDSTSAPRARQDQIPQESPTEILERAKAAKKFREMSAQADNKQRSARAYPPVSADECQEVEGADRPEGVVLDHNYWCHTGDYKLATMVCTATGCKEKSHFRYRLNTLGTVKSGARSVAFVSSIKTISIREGEPGFKNRVVTLDMKCTKSTGSTCKGDPLNKQGQSISKWLASPSAYFTLSSPETGSINTDKVSWHEFAATSTLDGGDTKPVPTGANSFRCDSATYAGTHSGCVYDKTTELFYDMDVADPEVNETAQHIIDAQTGRVPTFPDWAGKTVPGSALSGKPLTRVFHDKAQRDANHRQAVKTCKEHFGADYASRGLECDEYPFQSTTQGAASGDNKYSARALDGGDNGRGGTKLGQFYTRQRVLDGDAFYVLVVQ